MSKFSLKKTHGAVFFFFVAISALSLNAKKDEKSEPCFVYLNEKQGVPGVAFLDKHDVEVENIKEPIPFEELSDFIARRMYLTNLIEGKTTLSSHIKNGNVLPSASFTFYIPNLPEAVLEQMSFFDDNPLNVFDRNLPYEIYSSLASFGTASSPSEHNILIKNKDVSERSKANLIDLFNQKYNGNSLTVSFSSDNKMVDIFGAHPQVETSNSRSNLKILFNENTGSFESRDQPIFSKHELKDLLLDEDPEVSILSHLKLKGVVAEVDKRNGLMRISNHEGVISSFDIFEEHWFKFLSELQVAFSLPDHLVREYRKEISDSIPDCYVEVFSSASLLFEDVTVSSNIEAVSMFFLKSLKVIVSKSAGVYSSNLSVSEVIFMGRDDYLLNSKNELIEKAQKQIGNIVTLNLKLDKSKFPELRFLKRNGEDVEYFLKKELCGKLIDQNPHFIKYYEPVLLETYEDPKDPVSGSGGENKGAGDFVFNPTYHIVLWLSILLILALVFFVYGMMNMENKQDTLLYSNSMSASIRKNQ